METPWEVGNGGSRDLPPIIPFRCEHQVYPHTKCPKCKFLGERAWPKEGELTMCHHHIFPSSACTLCRVERNEDLNNRKNKSRNQGSSPKPGGGLVVVQGNGKRKVWKSVMREEECQEIARELFGGIYVSIEPKE